MMGPKHTGKNGHSMRKRGKRGGALTRLRQRCFRPPLPSMFLSNVRCLSNKMDELTANIQSRRDYRECCVFCLSETWLHPDVPDSAIQPPGFAVYRADRTAESGKQGGGGVCFLISKRWCTDVKVISRACYPDLEFITIQCRPFYLPREMSSVTLIAVYIHPKANPSTALRLLADEITACENSFPDSALIIAGDFNKANLKRELPKFYQQVDCPTRGDNTLDHCYTSIKKAYHSVTRASLGKSDHKMVYLVPVYRQKMKTEKPVVKTVKRWTTPAVETLQGCFECTDWDVFKESTSSLHEYAETVCDYVSFCEEMCIPTMTIKMFPNNKPWLNNDVRQKLREKEIAFRSDDKAGQNRAKRNVEKSIKQAKFQYRKKIEENLTANNARNVWTGLRSITDYKMTHQTLDTTDKTLPDKLNTFYSRFDTPLPCDDALNPTVISPSPFIVQEYDVKRNFSHLKVRKAAGPDNISSCLLKKCAAQLSGVFTDIFNLSLQSCKVPRCFKKSTIIPVPKKAQPVCLNDYRPVALTSVVMKSFERLVLQFLKTCFPPSFDPYQFAYRANRSVEDAVSIALYNVLNHLEHPGNYARVLFIDYSSAFNTIVPTKLYFKLKELSLSESICAWVLDFLRGRAQVVKVGDVISSTCILNTGAPQGCVLSPLLYSLFTYDCTTHHEYNAMIKFADDTTLEGLITNDDESKYRQEVFNLIKWCDNNNLELNVSKTKEIIFDFRKNKLPNPLPLVIKDKEVEIVTDFKLLGLIISNDLKWGKNTVKIVKKAQQRLYFLRRLKKFRIKTEILVDFYRAVIESVLTFGITVWYGNISKKEAQALNKIVKTATKIIGCDLPSLEEIYNKRLHKKAMSVIEDQSHPAFGLFEMLPSGRRFRTIRAKTYRFANSFFPKAVKALSQTS